MVNENHVYFIIIIIIQLNFVNHIEYLTSTNPRQFFVLLYTYNLIFYKFYSIKYGYPWVTIVA